MATNKQFAFAALANYSNSTAAPATNFQKAFVTDCKKFVAKCGYPSKDEIGIMDEKIAEVDVTNTVTQIPELISGFMHDEQRAFDLPAPDNNTAPATIKVVQVPEKTSEGVQTIGPNAGQKWKSTIKAHEEPKLKIRRDMFKK
jgi:hypothetical protein